MKRFLGSCTLAVVCSFWLQARQDPSICGTHGVTWQEELHLHRQSTRALAASGRLRTMAAPVARDVGNIAILDDSSGVVAHPNVFNLDGKTIVFNPTKPAASAYQFQVEGQTFDSAAATGGTPLAGIGDDDFRLVTLPFTFAFFGGAYTQVYINSDGNVTFGSPDAATASRSLGRFTAGPPRIAPLFRDLDPTRAPTGLRVLSAADRVVISWVAVPDYSAGGSAEPSTFQLRLFPGGRIEMAWSGIAGGSAVVGIAPGKLQGGASILSLAGGSSEEFFGAIGESFGSTDQIDIVRAAQRFYEAHEDAYDYLVFYNTVKVPARDSAIALEVTVRNSRTGYGDELVSVGDQYGSPRRLQAVVNMGPVDQYATDVHAPVPRRSSTGDTALSVIGHEFGHLFLAFASIRDPFNADARPMLGFQGAHWNFNFNSEASLLEGNRILDRGPAASPRFETIATVEGYAPLDQYLMGFRAKEEVPPTFLVQNSGPSRLPQVGVQFDGTRRDIGIDEIIAIEGRRTPDDTVSQRTFRAAFVLIVAAGTEPDPAVVEQVETYRREFVNYFRDAASSRATVETTLQRSLALSAWPAAGVVVGDSATASVKLARPAESDVTVRLTPEGAAIQVPNAVRIPAGQQQAAFSIRGNSPAVSMLTASIDDAYETQTAKIQVLANPQSLKTIVVSGDNQVASGGAALGEPVVLRVVDQNQLPYAGRRVVLSASAGGQVEPAAAVSDENGEVSVRWTPSSNPLNELYAAVDGSAAVPATVTALGPPSIWDNGIVNAASFAAGIAPNTLGTIFGANLGAGANGLAAGLADSLFGVQLLLNGTPAPLVYVSNRQINFLAPQNLPQSGEVEIKVVTPLGTSAAKRLTLQPLLPGIFYNPPTGFGAILISGTANTTFERPAERGDYLEIYATGLGPIRSSTTVGPQLTVATPNVFLAGQPVAVQYSGLAPGFLGLYQVNVQVPASAPSGDLPLYFVIGGQKSNEVRVRVR